MVWLVWLAVEDKDALAWSSTVSVAAVACEPFEEFGSLAVNEIVLTPRFDEVAGRVQGWLAPGQEYRRRA